MCTGDYDAVVEMRYRLLLLFCTLCVAMASAALRHRPNQDRTLAEWLDEKWNLKTTTIELIDSGNQFTESTWLALAPLPRNNTKDLYVIRARLTEEGVPIRVHTPINLSLSEWADDTNLRIKGHYAITQVRDHLTAKVVEIHVRNFEPPPTRRKMSRIETWKRAAANWAETGQSRGVGLRVWQVNPPADSVQTEISHLGEVSFHGSDARFVEVEQHEREELPLLHWVANVGRKLRPTDRFVALLKEVYFSAHNMMEVTREAIADDTSQHSSLPVRIYAVEEARKKAAFQIRDQKRPWPPPPLPVLLPNPRDNEGLWIPVANERVTKNQNAPEPFYQSFIRTNPKHSHKRVFISIW
ncbi:MAG TPA: hypothetical protein EYN66_07230, partial [Myxococcales bacterium]|nr:hypothetical protein [Myxococcales bacterium]